MHTLEFPSSALGERAKWLADQLSGAAPPATAEEAATVMTGENPVGTLEWLRSEAPGFVAERWEQERHSLFVYGTCTNGRKHQVIFSLEREAPERIRNVTIRRALPPGMEVRPATPEDNDDIVHICRNTPIVLGDTRITIDHGPDYFAYLRLMDRKAPLVIAENGRPVAIQTSVVWPATIAGRPVRLAQVMHSRVLPEYSRLGLWSVLQRRAQEMARERYRDYDDTPREPAAQPAPVIGCGFIGVENDAVHQLAGSQGTWKCRPIKLTLPASRGDGVDTTSVKRASPAAVDKLVEIINAGHDRQQLFRLYTAESLTSRLERAPDLYSWSDVLLSDGAAVGVWHVGQRRTKVDGEHSHVSIRSLVLDYGFMPGHEAELEQLLRVACHEAGTRGCTHLSLFTSEPAAGFKMLEGLSDGFETYEFAAPRVQEPGSTAEHGIYVDHVYF